MIARVAATTLEQAVEQLYGRGAALLLLEQPVEHGNLSWAVLHFGRPVALLQRPLDRGQDEPLAAARDRLAAVLTSPDGAALREIVPLPRAEVRIAAPGTAQRYHLWEWIEGRRFDPGDLASLPLWLGTAGGVLSRIQSWRTRGWPAPGAARFRDWCDRWAGVADAPQLLPLRQAAIERLVPELGSARCGLSHGDFWYGNLLLTPRGGVLVDWEECALDGLHWIDPLLFTLTLLLDLSPGSSTAPTDGPQAPEVLRWCAAQADLPTAALPSGLILAGCYKARRERDKYGQHDTPVQRWLSACAREGR